MAVLLLIGAPVPASVRAQPTEPAAQEEEALADTILALTDVYNAAWEALDPEAILRFHSDDFRYYWRGSSAGMSSKAAFERVLRDEILPGMRKWSAEVIDPQVEMLGRDGAVVSFEFTSEAEDTAGEPFDYGAGALSYVFERRDEGWPIVLIHESDLPEPADPSELVEGTDPDSSFIAALLLDLSVAEEKVLALAEAFSQAEYDWRPAEGVRSGAEVFMHMAATSFGFSVVAGYEAPASTGLTAENLPAAVPAYARSLTSREDVRPALGASFETLRTAIESSASNLERQVTVFDTPVTLRALWLDQVGHLREHLGQLIAYSRVNGIVPPWSR